MRPLSLMRVGGIRVIVDPTWFLVFALVVVSLGSDYLPAAAPHLTAFVSWILAVVAALLLFGSVLVHELSHAWLARRAGIAVPRIRLFLFGGVSEMMSEPHEPRAELRIAAAGPATSLLIAAVAYACALGLEGTSATAPRVIVEYLAVANLLLGMFNLLPGLPLDGGRILRAWLWWQHGNLLRATRTAGRVGVGLGWTLAALGFARFISGAFSGGWLGGLWLVIIGLFLSRAALATAESSLLRESLRGMRVRQLMTRDVATVPDHISLEEMVREIALHRPHDSYPVLADGQFAGVIGIDQVRHVPRDEWIRTPVRQVMTPAAMAPPLGPEDECLAALERMLREDRGLLAVVTESRLIGVLSRVDVLKLHRLRSSLDAAG
jgi:Zn-dependent protease/CBS domain-containing protein